VKPPLLKLAKKQDIRYKFKPRKNNEFTITMQAEVPRSYFVDFLQKTKRLHKETKNVRFEDLERDSFQLTHDLAKKVFPAFKKWVQKIERQLRADTPTFAITFYQVDDKNLPSFKKISHNKFLFKVAVKGYYHE